MATGYPQYAAYQLGGQSAAVLDVKNKMDEVIGAKADASDEAGTVNAKVRAAIDRTKELGNVCSASANIKYSVDTERGTGSTSDVKLKEIQAPIAGIVRVMVEGRTQGSAGDGTVSIYKNGGLVQAFSIDDTYTVKSADVSVNKGDLLQGYLRAVTASRPVTLRNFRVAYDVVSVGGVKLD